MNKHYLAEWLSHTVPRDMPPSQRRRTLLRMASVLAASAIVAPLTACRTWMEPHFDSDPFTLGVASGSPRADSIVLWTRLAPAPFAGGGMQPANVDVRWELAHDEGFHDIARTGVEIGRASCRERVSGLG